MNVQLLVPVMGNEKLIQFLDKNRAIELSVSIITDDVTNLLCRWYMIEYENLIDLSSFIHVLSEQYKRFVNNSYKYKKGYNFIFHVEKNITVKKITDKNISLTSFENNGMKLIDIRAESFLGMLELMLEIN